MIYSNQWVIDHRPDIIEVDEFTNEWCIILNNVICHTGFKKDTHSMFLSEIDGKLHIIALRLI